MKPVFICLAIALLGVAAVQELGCSRSHASIVPSIFGKSAGAETTPASKTKDVSSYVPLASNLRQRREVLDQFGSDPGLKGNTHAESVGGAAPVSHEKESPDALLGKEPNRCGPLYPEGAKVTGEGSIFMLVSRGQTGTNACPRQKFMVRLASGQALLVVHEATCALAVEALKLGDRVAFCGTYTHGLNGDEINRTCRNDDQSDGGWIRHNGKTYQ